MNHIQLFQLNMIMCLLFLTSGEQFGLSSVNIFFRISEFPVSDQSWFNKSDYVDPELQTGQTSFLTTLLFTLSEGPVYVQHPCYSKQETRSPEYFSLANVT